MSGWFRWAECVGCEVSGDAPLIYPLTNRLPGAYQDCCTVP